MNQIKIMITRLQKPSVLLSLISQIVAFLILMGVRVDGDIVMAFAVAICSILATLGILSNPDTKNKGYGDDFLKCSNSGIVEPHALIDGGMICRTCGAHYISNKQDTQ